jgi:disulfide bond formation protein DsbB
LRTLTGIPCPLCGMTRACVAAVHGHVGTSLAFNPAGVIVMVAAVIALVRPQWLTRRPVPMWGAGIAIAMLWVWNVGFNPTFHHLLLR